MSELTSHESTVNSFYLAFYGRPADPAGLKFWAEQLANNDGDHRAIIDAFATSREAQVRFGDDTPAERIAEIYQQLFNRTPEQSGVDYWAEVVAQGNASLADVAIEILKGAQGTDKGLLDLRQQAGDAFTAEVETSGSDYAGYSSIEAARVLVRAVTPGASQADIAQVVKATVAFADIASNNPAVIDAIATGSSLLALFDTARGKADPVVLVQALADVAAAAAGSPATLESLLRGGGMAQVLKVMPANATLQDVVNALAQGGLPAAIDVVYPPEPVTPPQSGGVTLKFAGVDHHADDPTPGDNVTNQKYADVKFGFTGTLSAGQKFQYKVGESAWTDVAPTDKTIVVPHVDLSNGVEQGRNMGQGMGIMEVVGDLVTKVQVRVVNASGSPLTSVSEDIVYDTTDPAGQLTSPRIVGEAEGALTTTREIVDVTIDVSERDDGIVQWRVKGEGKWTEAQFDSAGQGAILKGIDLATSDPTIEVRVVDAAGNVGDQTEFAIDGPYSAGSVTVRMTPAGLRVESTVAGVIRIGDVVVTSDHESGGAIVGRVVVGALAGAVSGTLTVTPPGGQPIADGSGRSYVFGDDHYDVISGSNLWGFDGNDELTGTQGDDYLSGGAGNDTIYSEGGNDTIVGGQAGDTIYLSKGAGVATLVFESGDTLTRTFVSGDYLTGADRIHNAELGDVIKVGRIFDELPVVGNTLLDAENPNQVAVVRGFTDGSRFTISDNGTSYLVQWTDANGINSIFFNDFGAGGFGLEIDSDMGTMTLVEPPPVTSVFAGINYRFSKDESGFWLRGDPDDVIQAYTDSGLLDADGVALYDFSSGMPRALAVDYTDGAGFGVDASGYLNFDAPLATGVYLASWSSDAFATASGRFDSGAIAFAGGVNGNLFQQVFNIQPYGLQQTVKLGSGTTDNGSDGRSLMYEVNAGATAIVRTGTGRDVVDAGGGALTIQYANGNSKAQDLIFNFGNDDRIEFHFDGNVEPEALPIEALGPLSTAELAYDNSATMSNLKLELDNVVVGPGGALVLVRDGDNDAAMLLYYNDKDGNALADADEITLLATFSGGVPGFQQIDLIGMVSP